MSDLRLDPLSSLDGIARLGRGGNAGGPPGIVLTERGGVALVSMLARRRRSAALASAFRGHFGIDLPAPGKRLRGTTLDAIWAGPEQWLVLADEAAVLDLCGLLSEALADNASLSDQSDGRALIRLSGARAREVLAKGCGIDLDASVFAPGDAAVTSIAHIGAHLWQVDERPSFDVSVSRSFADSFWRFLTASAAEYGYEIGPPLLGRS